MGDSVPHNQFWTKCTFYPRVSIHIYFSVCLEWISDKNYLKIKYFDTAWSRVLIVSMPICPVTSSSENEDSQSSWPRIVTEAYHGYGCHTIPYHTIPISWVWMPLSIWIPYHTMVWYGIMGMDATQPVTRARKMPQSGGNTVTCHLFPPSWSWSSRSVHFSSPSVRIPIARLYISELLKPHIS